MSLQLLIVLLQEPPFRPGHVPMAPQPIDTRFSSSDVPQVWSGPPHCKASWRVSFVCARLIAPPTAPLVEQSVPAGRVPSTLAFSHFWSAMVTDRVYFADAAESARWQTRGSPWTVRGLTSATRALAIMASATRMRFGWWLRFIWLPRADASVVGLPSKGGTGSPSCVYGPGRRSCNVKIAGDPVFHWKKAGNAARRVVPGTPPECGVPGDGRSDHGPMVVVPLMLSAPGPGRPTAESSTELPELGMQVVAANAVVNVPIPAGVSGCPVCLISRALGNPKPPGFVWLGQKAPFGAGSVVVPLVVGASTTGRTPKNWPLEGGQSSVVPFVPTGE